MRSEPARTTRSVVAVLLAIVLVALCVRVGYVALAKRGPCPLGPPEAPVAIADHECAVGDQLYYNVAARRLAAGDGFVEIFDPQRPPEPGTEPAADHPPLTVVFLAGVSWVAERTPLAHLGDDSHVDHHRYAMALLGTGLVVLVGALGGRVGGARVAVVAAGLAAVAPNLWVNDGLVMSETPANLLVVGSVLAALRLARDRSLRTAAALGGLCGLALLTRAELLLLLPLVALPAALAAREGSLRRLAVVGATCALVVTPWVGYNLARFAEPTFVSTNLGIALAASNCEVPYGRDALGLHYLGPPCIDDPHPPGDQSEVSAVYQERALDYAREHRTRVPAVVAARVGRTWSAFRPLDMVEFNRGEGRERAVTRAGILVHLPLLALAVAGLVLVAHRDRRTAVLLAAPALIVTVGSALTYGQTRFRAVAEPFLVVLAAVALAAIGTVVHRHLAASPRPPPRTADR